MIIYKELNNISILDLFHIILFHDRCENVVSN
jgi:hypothetical protein